METLHREVPTGIVEGSFEARFAPVVDEFVANFADRGEEIHQMRIAQNTIAAFSDHGTTRKATGDLPI